VTLLAGAVAGSMALTSTTAFASSSHSSHARTVVVVKGNCNAVGHSSVDHCTSISRSHRHGHGNGEFDRHHGRILEGVGDIVGGLLGAL
jgi:hypothetical protein